MTYDCIIVGGGIAGLQAAIQLGRYSAYSILVIDAGGGRSSLCLSYHNIIGWPEGISGAELRQRGRAQAALAGVKFTKDTITEANKTGGLFCLKGQEGAAYEARTLLLATGLMDRFPDLPGLVPTLGKSVYVCPDCDGFEIQNTSTVTMGSGDSGANMALLLSERARTMVYINHERVPVKSELLAAMRHKGIKYIESPIYRVLEEEGRIQGVLLENKDLVPAERGFISFGGNHVHSELAESLGADLYHNRHVEADPRTRMTRVDHLWVAGDLGVHAEQVTVAMGDGVMAAISINKSLREMKS
ncbi:NAD(P)/FAD-dependent oxidoreductase [Paenibacillus sp. J22TS3]|uniref:NAD(P)/FAD-dependent oxidoreductase n=1 Tax=Paenibacillus sp. J22TS3 TaxID=2807192 RepID=UPI001B2F26E4|nr:NAD(P)/FAD-dependent oxidoreductase [Paenibacillus sp. J22TS3]GIP21655.1 thioredoxin reductase [Paenibacillus sp. J22TS3]